MLDSPLRYVTGSVQEGALVATITARIVRDAELAYALRDEIVALIDSVTPRKLVLDLKNVEFIGSVGLLAFLGVRRHLESSRIVLCNMSESLRKMFAACRLIPTDTAPMAAFEAAADLVAALQE